MCSHIIWMSMSIVYQQYIFFYHLHFGGLFPCFCEFSTFNLVSLSQDREPGIKPLLTVEALTFGDGNSNILKVGKRILQAMFPHSTQNV